ncbi:MAG: hypothetical protein GX066_05135 [Clostridiaceae bacterium]|nr:hypothetical protein [Clostridiaceae bacterium]
MGLAKGGTNIINSLSSVEGIRIIIVVDKNLDAPGIYLAKQLGIKVSSSIDEICKYDIDIIIEVTGSNKISQLLHEKYGNKCKIIDSVGAFLVMTLVEKNIVTLKKLNDQITAINNASITIYERIKEISNSIRNVHNVSKNLLNSAKTSSEYINKSDSIIQYVTSISKQIRILGLNATIEAARSGEHGRGFSVVANEVQKLSISSESCVKEISNILSKISNEMENISKEIDELNRLSSIQLEALNRVNLAVDNLIAEINN